MRLRHPSRSSSGYALVMVLILTSATLFILAGTLSWGVTNSRLTERNNQYFRTVAAAEAATEKIITRLAADYQSGGEALVFANLNSYRLLVPTQAESPLLKDFRFSDGQGQESRSYMAFVPPGEFRVLTAQYRGLRGYSSAFRIISNAKEANTQFTISAAVRQDVEVATIPLFQFAIFYNLDLEINPGAVMSVDGAVHGNRHIYLQPQNTLTFEGDVTAAGDIITNKKPGDPSSRPKGTIVFQEEHDGGVSTLNLPIGTNNSPAAVRQVVEVPPFDESVHSPMGKERFYNKADLVIVVNDSGVSVRSGRINNFGTTVPQAQWQQFLNKDTSFFNKRENKTVAAIQIDVSKLRQWNQTNTLLRPVLPFGDVRIVYVDDQRNLSSSQQSGVRLINGQTILPRGLTVATPEPIYVKGNYNVPSAALGTSDTSGSLPAALIGDAITVLSDNWNDANSSSGLSSRTASHTTVNAAFLAGIVETVEGSYSGGVENFPRFLENWSGKHFTYNGSMVVMFDSKVAKGQWRGTGDSIGIYNPPNRKWAFDLNFRDPNKLPPGTPALRVLIRSSWATIRPNTVAVN